MASLQGSSTRKQKRGPYPHQSRRAKAQHSPIMPTDVRPSTPKNLSSIVDAEVLSSTLSTLSLGTNLTPKSRLTGQGKVNRVMKGERLFYKPSSSSTQLPKWTELEERSLVSFLMVYTKGEDWVAHKDMRFWDQAGQFVHEQAKTSHCRSGMACRWRAASVLSKRFKSPHKADTHFSTMMQPSLEDASIGHTPSSYDDASIGHASSSQEDASHSASSGNSEIRAISSQDRVDHCIASLDANDQLVAISRLFSQYLNQHTPVRSVPSDFLSLVVRGMSHLQECNRSNVIYSLAKVLGTSRPSGVDSLLPAKRMPFGLVEYTVNFFAEKSTQKVSCPPDYRSWLQTMYTLFGMKWAKIFSGPLWSYQPIAQLEHDVEDELDDTVGPRNPVKAMVNVPSLSERTLRRDIAASGFTTGSEIQHQVLEEAAVTDPDAAWWIKADGCDLVKGLFESVAGVWSGDIDLNDGALQSLKEELQSRLSFIQGVGLTAIVLPQVSAGAVPFYRYFNGFDHFYTTSAAEIGTTTSGQVGIGGFRSEGTQCLIHNMQAPGTVPLYCYYNGKEHFNTTNSHEIGTITPGVVGKHGHRFEGIAGYCYPIQPNLLNITPLYRGYIGGSDHFYTTDLNEIVHHKIPIEGIACYVVIQ